MVLYESDFFIAWHSAGFWEGAPQGGESGEWVSREQGRNCKPSSDSAPQKSHSICSVSSYWFQPSDQSQLRFKGREIRLYLFMGSNRVTMQKVMWNGRYFCGQLWKIQSASEPMLFGAYLQPLLFHIFCLTVLFIIPCIAPYYY